ncbi:unnamed protein product, partial [Phaeothamnion confervicola]
MADAGNEGEPEAAEVGAGESGAPEQPLEVTGDGKTPDPQVHCDEESVIKARIDSFQPPKPPRQKP